MWRFVAIALAVLICGYPVDAQETKAAYAVKSDDCKTAASCRVQCKGDDILVSALCMDPKKEKGKYIRPAYDGKSKASCPAPSTYKMFGVCMQRGALKGALKKAP